MACFAFCYSQLLVLELACWSVLTSSLEEGEFFAAFSNFFILVLHGTLTAAALAQLESMACLLIACDSITYFLSVEPIPLPIFRALNYFTIFLLEARQVSQLDLL